MRKLRPSVVAAALALAAAGVSGTAFAGDATIKTPGDHPNYIVELEPHGLLGWGGFYAADLGFGAGFRASINLVKNGFVPQINNSVAISFGLDFVHYGGCFRNIYCDADYLFFPVALQWNFYVAKRWSVFGEPGLAIYHAFFPTGYCPPGTNGCPGDTGITPVFYVGGRFHFNEHVALTMRVGYPSISVGVSFLL